MRLILYPISILYGSIMQIRNLLFDYNILKSKSHNIPIICIGNLSIGGSGKTPHTDYIAKLLTKKYQVAILSRGYKRKTSTFNYVELNSSTSDVGDEPLQLKKNNPNCIVAVNNDRNQGVNIILKDYPKTNVILLDDGFQHRKIKAGLNIIITPFQNPFTSDNIIPLGTLRESAKEAKRGNIIMISRTPKNIKSNTKKNLIEKFSLKTYQQAFFSSVEYTKYRSIYNDAELKNEQKYSVTLVSGIANSNHLINHLKKQKINVKFIKFSDHHNYTVKDIKKILSIYNKDKSTKKLILTTEKDATKLREMTVHFNQQNVYYIPIKIIINEDGKFEKQILNYVKSN